MKKLLFLPAFILLGISCQDEVVERYIVEQPEYMTYTDLRKAVKLKSGSVNEFKNPGKIYFWNNYLFINELNSGIHVIDNSDPANPVFKTFISIPGNVDISIKDGILYADSYIDLVALDISNMDAIKEVARLDSIFPYTLPDIISDFPVEQVDQSKGVVTGYAQRYVEKDLYNPETRSFPYYRSLEKMSFGTDMMAWNSVGSGSGTGVGGSMARFTIAGEVLYAINNSSEVHIFNIVDVNKPVKSGTMTVNWGIETLFPYNNKLFIGSQTGMIIYDLANPLQPQFISSYQHVRSCDPVVVEGNYAYVTLRTGTRCFGNVNRLDIVDISNLYQPKEVKTYDMTNPHGLGIDNNILFLCDGEAGLKIYDASDKYKLHENMLAHYPNNRAFDVIPLQGVLMMVGDSGIYQYDYKEVTDIKLLSKILINK